MLEHVRGGQTRPAGKRVIRRQHRHHLVDAADLHDQALVRHRRLDDAQVDLVVLHHGDDAVGVGDPQADDDVRELSIERAEQRGQLILGDGGARAEYHHAGYVAGERAHLALHARVELEDLLCVVIDALTGLGETDAVVGAVEKPGVELLLELPHLKGDRRLGHVQCRGGLGEAQVLGHRVEDLQAPIRHASPLVAGHAAMASTVQHESTAPRESAIMCEF